MLDDSVAIRFLSQANVKKSLFTKALAITLALSGCGGARSTDRTTTSAHDNAWFCQMADQEGWECVQDAALVANPGTDRLPPTLPEDAAEPNVAPVLRTAPETGQAIPSAAPPVAANTPARPVQSPDTPPIAAPRTEPPPPPSDADGDRPAYQRLAYQPDRPMQLSELPSHFLAVQLVALTSKEDLETWVKGRHLTGMSAARIARDNTIYYVLLLGVYPDTRSAELAVESRPAALRDLTPWIRPLGTLQEAMRAADALTGSTEF